MEWSDMKLKIGEKLLSIKNLIVHYYDIVFLDIFFR